MSIHTQATYRDGVIYPEQPLDLPENTRLDVFVTPLSPQIAKQRQMADQREQPIVRPAAPRITAQQFGEISKRHAVSVGSLPPDFSRADIYQDHD